MKGGIVVQIEKLPALVKEKGRFCVWKYEKRKGKPTKVPYNPVTGRKARPNDPATFATLAECEAVLDDYDGLGVGIFGEICAIDIDHCIDANGEMSELCEDIVATMDSYTEYSPSGTGVRTLFFAPGFAYDKLKYYINNRKLGLEIYVAGATGKFVTVTGNALAGSGSLEERGAELHVVLDRHMQREKGARPPETPHSPTNLSDDTVLAKAMKAGNGAAFSALWNGDTDAYPSQSEAELALCSHLAFYTGCHAEQMDRLMRLSGLFRDKWDSARAGSTYGDMTVRKAIAGCREVYNPQAYFAKRVAEFQTDEGGAGRTLAELHPDKNERYGWHDMGNGNLFADWYRETARYVPERKKWFIYNGKVWLSDTGDLKVMELCKRLADTLMLYALSIPDDAQRQAYIEFVKRWQRRNYRETVLRDAASVYPAGISEFDADPFLFNCRNGTLNLQTGEFYRHCASDMLSKLSGVKYVPQARSLRWERFVEEIMQGDREKAVFLQKSLGYAITGDTRHECFFVLYGPTSRNGKGTAMETFMRLMGDYGKTAKPETIAQKQSASGSGPSEDIARLAGARFVNISEPDKRLILSAALVKTLTGNDTVTARFLNENSFEYRPQFKLFINTNHLPTVTDVTLFTSGRVKIIPFERHFDEAERDDRLKSELARSESLSGILNWCLDGLRLIDQTGFEMPEAVREATDEYRKNSDRIGRFLEEEMDRVGAGETRTGDAYNHYKQWCSLNGFFPENAANFKASLSNVATVVLKRPKNGGGATNLLVGYRLKSEFQAYTAECCGS